MNYIPGFSNYLETTAARYARGGPARLVEEDIYGGGYDGSPLMYSDPMAGVAPSMDAYQQAAVMPMTTEAVSPAISPAVAPTTQAAASAAAPETEAQERARLTAYLPAALLGGANPNDFDMGFLRQMAKSADRYYWDQKEAAYKKANPNGIYALADPAEYFKAYGTVPVSFTGMSGYMDKGVKGPSIDYLTPEAGATYSLYSPKTGQLIGTGTGVEGLLALTKQANEMNESQGRKADFQLVKTGAGSTTPEVLGTNLYNSDRTALGKVMGVVGQALPLAAMAIPGLNVLGTIAVGAGLGGVGAQLQGKNALKGAAMGGLSAAGGQLLGPALGNVGNMGLRAGTAIGTGLGATAGGLVTGQSLKNSLLGGVASGALSYMSPDITQGLKGLGIIPGANVNTGSGGGSGGGGYDGILVNASPAVTPIKLNTSLGGSQNKIQQALKPKTETPYDGLTVTGGKFGNVGFDGDLFGADRFGTPGKGEVSLKELDPEDIVVDATRTTPVAAPVTGGLSPDVLAGIAEFEKNPIISEGSKIEQTTPVSAPVTSVGGGEITPEYLPKEDIVVDATERTTPVSGGLTLSSDTLADIDKGAAEEAEAKKKLGLEGYLRLASLATGLLGNLGGGKGGSDQTGTYVPGGAGSGRLNPIFSAQLPAAGALGSVGATRTARPLGDVDWLTYGQRPELKFFDYAVRNNPAPVTTPVPGNPAGPIMEERDPMVMAEGGALAAKRGGRSRRTEFAVNGPGTGRSDDIPAVLSDGEYVIDAETVALLGDGSSKAGAKKLDDLRVKVRKHKGKKLAKGRFSANAKKPEAYLSGGRI